MWLILTPRTQRSSDYNRTIALCSYLGTVANPNLPYLSTAVSLDLPYLSTAASLDPQWKNFYPPLQPIQTIQVKAYYHATFIGDQQAKIFLIICSKKMQPIFDIVCHTKRYWVVLGLLGIL